MRCFCDRVFTCESQASVTVSRRHSAVAESAEAAGIERSAFCPCQSTLLR